MMIVTLWNLGQLVRKTGELTDFIPAAPKNLMTEQKLGGGGGGGLSGLAAPLSSSF